jgi:prophage tail gpP-like protein
MSRTHNVQEGDTLGSIAIRYLGNSGKWTKINATNPQLSNRKKTIDGSPLIYPGDTLIIPEDQTESRPTTAQTKKLIVLSEKEQDVSIVIDGEKFTGFTAYNLTLAYDTFDTFSFSAPYDSELKELREVIKPFTFKPCEVYYNDVLLFKGTFLTPDPELTDQTSEITLQGYPLCGVLNDCMVPPTKYPLQCMGITMKGIADAACEPYSIPVIFEGEVGPVFTEVSIEPTDKILDFLSRLSKQRNLLFTNNEKGQLVFFNPKSEKAFVSFVEGKLPLISIKPKFNAQDFFSHITGFGKTDAEYPSLSYTFENKYLINRGIIRHHSLTIEDAETISDLENSVKAHAGRMFADCVNFELLCENHVNENNEVFQKGMTVCVLAPSAMTTRETNFIARSVKLSRTTEGKTTTLALVLSGSYTGEIPEALPWE